MARFLLFLYDTFVVVSDSTDFLKQKLLKYIFNNILINILFCAINILIYGSNNIFYALTSAGPGGWC